MYKHYCKTKGFTLLEMLVVVGVLMAIAGVGIIAVSGMQERATQQTVLFEMQKIKSALRQYKLDVGSYPAPSNPADFSALYSRSTEPVWDIASSRGWRGPYVTAQGEGLVDIGDDLAADGAGSPTVVNVAAHQNVRAIADGFIHAAIKNNSVTPCHNNDLDSACLLDFRSEGSLPRHLLWGRPYFLFELSDSARARLVSSGVDGIYAGVNTTDICEPKIGSDDFVLCLSR